MIVEGRITDESIKSKLTVDEYGLFRDKNFCDTCGHQYSDICGVCGKSIYSSQGMARIEYG